MQSPSGPSASCLIKFSFMIQRTSGSVHESHCSIIRIPSLGKAATATLQQYPRRYLSSSVLESLPPLGLLDAHELFEVA